MQITEFLCQLDSITKSNQDIVDHQIKLKERLIKYNVEKELMRHEKLKGKNNGKTNHP